MAYAKKSCFLSLMFLGYFFSSYVCLAEFEPVGNSHWVSNGNSSNSNSSSVCKAIPNTPSWPSKFLWDTLNASISGHLIFPLPPAAVCDPALPVFNNASCQYVASKWNSSDFHARDPTSVDQPNFELDACLPVPGSSCDLRQFPRYVVNATQATHVKAAVDFARIHSVRLIVKGTGHDYLGRSTAPDSLSIWTHHIRGLRYYDSFTPSQCSVAPVSAISVAAGHRMFEIYEEAAAHGSIIVGGDDPDVGIGGYLTGGGHSPISGQYGLAADNVVQFEVVTPAGEVKILNQCSNTDLFFAFRGGGGSTFGVILSATLKTFPIPSVSWSHFTVTQTQEANSTNDTFWQAVAYFHSKLPYMVKSGMMGYFNITTLNQLSNTTINSFRLEGGLTMLNASVVALDTVFDPVLKNLSGRYPVDVSATSQFSPSFYEWWKVYYPAGAVAYDSVIGNRFLDEKALNTPLPQLADGLAHAYPNLVILGNLVTGSGVWEAKPPGGLGSMTPAWRKAVVELILPVKWPPRAEDVKAQQLQLLTNTYVPWLRRLAPDTGCYLNEADPNEPSFHQAFWGDNYARLLGLKRKYDPAGVFWCSTCVGQEAWTLDQKRLCRA